MRRGRLIACVCLLAIFAAAAGSFGVFHVFHYWLKMPLPTGVLGL